MIAWTPPGTYTPTAMGRLIAVLEQMFDDLRIARCGVEATAADLLALPTEGRINRIYRITATKKLASFDGTAWYYADGSAV